MAKDKDRRRDEKAAAKADAKEGKKAAKATAGGALAPDAAGAAAPDAKGKGKDGKVKAKKAKRVKPKPKGMRWVNPYLSVRDVDVSLAWYERAFGFRTTFSMPGPDGKPLHAEMTHRKSTIMLQPESIQGHARAPGKDGASVTLFCYCEDVDATAASARAAGGKILDEPRDQFWGDRTCFIVDPDGHQWMFATHKFDIDPDEPLPMPVCEEADEAPDTPAAAAPPALPAPAPEKSPAKPARPKPDASGGGDAPSSSSGGKKVEAGASGSRN